MIDGSGEAKSMTEQAVNPCRMPRFHSCTGRANALEPPLALANAAFLGFLSQPPLEVLLQIPHRLEPDGDAQQALGDPGARARFGAYPPVRRGGGMGDRGLRVAQVRRYRDVASGLDHPPRRVAG